MTPTGRRAQLRRRGRRRRASAGCTCCTTCATWASRRRWSRRRRRRRHVVLEPVPGRPLRRREPELLVLVLAESSSRSGPGARSTRPQPEILAYANHVADRFDLRKDIEFETRVEPAVWDDDTAAGRSPPRRARRSRRSSTSWPAAACRTPSCPRSRASRASQGPTYHTGHWPHEGVDLTGMRVGVIGTGSSGIQSIPIIAEQAAQLTVFQRTPNFCMPAGNRPLDADEVGRDEGDLPASTVTRRASRGSACPSRSRRSRPWRSPRRSATPPTRRAGTPGTSSACCSRFTDLLTTRKPTTPPPSSSATRSARIVKDPQTAEDLCPHDHPLGTKRPCLDTGYYETFNRDNVELVNLRRTPIVEITPTGIRTTRAGVRVRRHRLRHRLRRHDRRAGRRRHPGPRRAHAEGEVGATAPGPTSA